MNIDSDGIKDTELVLVKRAGWKRVTDHLHQLVQLRLIEKLTTNTRNRQAYDFKGPIMKNFCTTINSLHVMLKPSCFVNMCVPMTRFEEGPTHSHTATRLGGGGGATILRLICSILSAIAVWFLSRANSVAVFPSSIVASTNREIQF